MDAKSNKTQSTQARLLTVDDLVARWKVTRRWVYEHHRLGNIPRAHIPGRLLRFDPDVIDALALGQFEDSHSSLKTKEKGKKLGRKLRNEELWS